jgi:hypothetical protein
MDLLVLPPAVAASVRSQLEASHHRSRAFAGLVADYAAALRAARDLDVRGRQLEREAGELRAENDTLVAQAQGAASAMQASPPPRAANAQPQRRPPPRPGALLSPAVRPPSRSRSRPVHPCLRLPAQLREAEAAAAALREELVGAYRDRGAAAEAAAAALRQLEVVRQINASQGAELAECQGAARRARAEAAALRQQVGRLEAARDAATAELQVRGGVGRGAARPGSAEVLGVALVQGRFWACAASISPRAIRRGWGGVGLATAARACSTNRQADNTHLPGTCCTHGHALDSRPPRPAPPEPEP